MTKREIHCSHDLPISQCPPHWIEFCEMAGDTVEQRAVRWLLSDDTGTSSKTLCAFMLGHRETNGGRGWGRSYPPCDADDRGRCIRLLKLIPEWIDRLPELAEENVGGLQDGTDEPVERSWAYQINLILKEGGFS